MSSITSVIGPFGSGPGPGGGGGGGGANPYTWYPSLDLDTIPFTVNEAAAPVTTIGNTNVTTAAGLEAAAVSGALITVTADIGDATIGGFGETRADIDIIINSGVRCGALTFQGNMARIRVRGPTLGTYSGGSIASWYSGYGAVTQSDFIIDGIGISFDRVGGQHPILPHDDVNRMAINACRVRGGHCATYFSNVRHLVVTNTSMSSGANPVDGSQVEVWTIRHDGEGPLVVYDCDLRSERTSGGSYHRVRSSPPVGTQTSKDMWVKNCTLVDLSNGLMLWAMRIGANGATDRHNSAYFINNTGYGQGTDFLDKMHPYATQTTAVVTGNTIYGIPSASSMTSSQGDCEAASITYSGQVHNSFTTPPAWGAAGDPTGLPLV